MSEALSSMTLTHFGAFSLIAGMLTISLFAVRLAKRKGYSGPILVWAWIPGANVCAFMLCARLPDRRARERMDALAARLARPGMDEK